MIGLLLRARDNALNVFTVHEPPDPPADRIDRAGELVFLKDGFSWGAALFGPLYFLVRGHWLGLAAYLAVATVLLLSLAALGLAVQWTSIAVLALNIYFGFESANLERAWLEWRGWSEIGTVVGRNQSECERRFFETWLEEQPLISGLGKTQTAQRSSAWNFLPGARA